MNETPSPVTSEPAERYKILIVVLTLITTVITALVATLQADANIRANAANRDSQYYAILASGELHRSGLQSSYDMNTFASMLRETQTSLMMQFTALQSEQAKDTLGITVNNISAMAAQARADELTKFSIFYSDPRYAPKTADGTPNTDAYLTDINAKAIELVKKQNAASDDYHKWSSKADSYVGVLTVMALSFLLLGLGQALTGKMRLVFAIFGAAILLGASVWAILILVA
jgi:DNA-binding helix-hairpin-helix protein with protein kinase domain